jgi:hypothetical protein
MELTHEQIERLVKRFPKLELSYETVAHKKVSPNYDICISVPNGKKQFAWFTYHEATDVCYLLDVNKDQHVTKVVKIATDNFDHKLAHETILYGSLCEINERQIFIIEDIYYFCGLPVKQLTFGEKLTYLNTIMSKYPLTSLSVVFALPYMSLVAGDNKLLDSLQFYESMTSNTAYITHHVQFRSSNTISPYLNHVYKKKQDIVVTSSESDVILFPRNDLDHYSQLTLKNAVFRVTADIQNDIYHLFAFDGYVNIAYIGSRESSVYMNNLFRNIRENSNIDLGEESEDEEIFQNVCLDKYVDLKKEYKMHCVYNSKFKKWVPINVVDGKSKIVITSDLLNKRNSSSATPYRSSATPYRSSATPYRSSATPYRPSAYKPSQTHYNNHQQKSYKSMYKK